MCEKKDSSDNIIPIAKEFVMEVSRQQSEEKLTSGDYGHAAGNLANNLALSAALGGSPEEQKRLLESEVLDLITTFGPQIIHFLRDELRLVVDNFDLNSEKITHKSSS